MAQVWPSSHHLHRPSMAIVFFWMTILFCANSANSVRANNDKSVIQSNSVDTTAAIWKSDTLEPESTCSDEYSCLAGRMGESERLALEAIKALHAQLDDDANGNIDLSESDEFLREELHYTGGHERRQKAFHRDDDMHISVRELWDIWTRSEVHNWTVEQTTDWLVHFVQLPQYVSHFQIHNINGTKLPRLAMNNVQYLGAIVGIKDPIHRQKISVKAMDVVLFGPPKDQSSHVKDITLVTLLVAAIAGAVYTYRSNRHSKQHLTKLMEHMEILSSAEKELQDLHVKLQHAREEQDMVLSEKMQLEQKLEQEIKGSSSNLFHADPLAELELRRLREEVEILRSELQRAEGELEDRLCWSPPPELQHWLQLTYELEQRVYNKKRVQAEKQLEQAKDACEKLNRKRSSFVASFVSTHGRTIDDVDKSILEARSSLMEVKQDLQERTMRWRQIETLCGFPIATNPGLNYLETLLRSGMNSSRYIVLNPSRQSTLEEDHEMGDETSSLVSSCAAAGPPVASAASLQPYTSDNRPKKYPLPKRESSVSLESASALMNHLNGNGMSASLSELAKTATPVIPRQKLSQRENSKDSAFTDVSTVSSITSGDTEADPSSTQTLRTVKSTNLIVAPTENAGSSSPSTVHRALIPEKALLSTSTHATVDPGRRSPLLPNKTPTITTRMSHPPPKVQEELVPNVPFKSSQSDSALDVVFQQATAEESELKQQQQIVEAEETMSTDSSIPGADEEGRKLKKKPRFQFSSLIKRNRNKT